MKNIIKLNESDLRRIVNRVIKENEEDWVDMSQDIEDESDFSQMDLESIPEFQELVDIFKNNKELADYYRERLGMNVNENYKYYDYGDNKKEITKSDYRKRKLLTYTVATLASAIVGYFMGTMAQDQVLEAALIAAGMGGPLIGALSSEVGREKVKDDEQITEMEDEIFMRDADKNWREREDYGTMRGRFFDKEDQGDEEFGQTDRGEEELQDLIEEARDFLEYECGYDLHDLNLMSEYDIVEALYDEGNDELAEEIEELLNQEGFISESATVSGVKIDASAGGLATSVSGNINKYSISVKCGKEVFGQFIPVYTGPIALSSIWGSKDGGIAGEDNTGKKFSIPFSKASSLASKMKSGDGSIKSEGEGTIAGVNGKCYVTLTKK